MKFPSRFRLWEFDRKYEYASIEECRYLQKTLLLDMLDYSIKNVPYYLEVAESMDIKPSLENVSRDIEKFPVLTKEILRHRFQDLKSESFKGSFHEKTSGGSTGEPAVFLQHYSFQQRNAATEMLFYGWAGRKPGGSMVRLWGDENYINRTRTGIKGLVRGHIFNTVILNSYRMSPETMNDYINIINRKKPEVIEGYVESLYELARFAGEHDIPVYSPRGVVSTAGTLYPEIKEFLRKSFNCRVINRYGSREAGDMACTCEKDQGFHQNVFNHYIEILDESLRPCKAGETGSIYVTTLHNRVMPLIRYKIGDVAVPAENEKCSCGRGMPLVREVRGRETEHFIAGNGEMVYAGYFRKLLYGLTWIRQYQIVQEDYGRIVYYFVEDSPGRAQTGELKRIEAAAKKAMGDGCRVDFEFVDEIKPSRSGKYLYTVNKVKDSVIK